MPESPPNYTDPMQGLEEALQAKIAAELYRRIMDALRSSGAQEHLAYKALLVQIEMWREQIEAKYKPLRDLIGLTGGSKNAT
jgi:hypothetical protein